MYGNAIELTLIEDVSKRIQEEELWCHELFPCLADELLQEIRNLVQS